MTPRKRFYENSAEKLISKLKNRNMEGYYVSTKEEAKNLALSFIDIKSTVSWGGSVTLEEIDLLNSLESNDYDLIDRRKGQTPEEKDKINHDALNADYYLLSTNAITAEGELVNIDGRGNRLAALLYGPKNIIIVAGMNKIVNNLDGAIQRIQNVAAPINSLRLDRKTPCSKTGICSNCYQGTICGSTVITRMSTRPFGNFKVILVGEQLGY